MCGLTCLLSLALTGVTSLHFPISIWAGVLINARSIRWKEGSTRHFLSCRRLSKAKIPLVNYLREIHYWKPCLYCGFIFYYVTDCCREEICLRATVHLNFSRHSYPQRFTMRDRVRGQLLAQGSLLRTHVCRCTLILARSKLKPSGYRKVCLPTRLLNKWCGISSSEMDSRRKSKRKKRDYRSLLSKCLPVKCALQWFIVGMILIASPGAAKSGSFRVLELTRPHQLWSWAKAQRGKWLCISAAACHPCWAEDTYKGFENFRVTQLSTLHNT